MEGLKNFLEKVYASWVYAIVKQNRVLIEANQLNPVNHLSSKHKRISLLGVERTYFNDGYEKPELKESYDVNHKAAMYLIIKSEY